MTDNEIIKALECCFIETNCTNFPLHISKPFNEDCLKITAEQALALINRQKAEIERLKKNNVERTDFLSKLIEAEKQKRKCSVRTAEIEAIKEFARRVKDSFSASTNCGDETFPLYCIRDYIDEIRDDMLNDV